MHILSKLNPAFRVFGQRKKLSEAVKAIEISEKTKEIILKGNRRLDIEWFS
jgi:hypothetical protein